MRNKLWLATVMVLAMAAAAFTLAWWVGPTPNGLEGRNGLNGKIGNTKHMAAVLKDSYSMSYNMAPGGSVFLSVGCNDRQPMPCPTERRRMLRCILQECLKMGMPIEKIMVAQPSGTISAVEFLGVYVHHETGRGWAPIQEGLHVMDGVFEMAHPHEPLLEAGNLEAVRFSEWGAQLYLAEVKQTEIYRSLCAGEFLGDPAFGFYGAYDRAWDHSLLGDSVHPL